MEDINFQQYSVYSKKKKNFIMPLRGPIMLKP